MMESIINWDKELFLFLNGLGCEKWDGFWLFITDKYSSIPIYILLLLLSFQYLKWKKTLWVLLVVALMIASTDQLANLFKDGFERLRPCHDESLLSQMRSVVCSGKFGYFSAHSASSLALATLFYLLLKPYTRWISIIFIWAFLVSYSRIYLGVHFPGDVLTGWLIGEGLAMIFHSILQNIFKKQKATQ